MFVSYWQQERYLRIFEVTPAALRRHQERDRYEPTNRGPWVSGPTWRCAYASTPFRGLSVLLDAWRLLDPKNAELHIWSSMKLYAEDDGPYEALYERARSLPHVFHHGVVPSPELRDALRSMHFLTYPSTFAETACLTVMEAMAEGCRVIVPSLGALPETTCGYARIYPWNPNEGGHAAVFAEVLRAELKEPWDGDPQMSMLEQAHCGAVYDLSRCAREWRQLICDVRDAPMT